MINRQILLAARPKGFPKNSDFQLVETPVPEPRDGEFLVQGMYLSVDPYMRGRMNDVKSYARSVNLGEVMVGEGLGRVIQSRNDRFPVGTHVAGFFGWQEYALSTGEGVRKIDPDAAPLSTNLHLLGMTGLTAYFGLFEVCRVQAGDTVLVSGAAGAVGSVVGQLAKLAGARAVGVAGEDDKVRWLTDDLGFDAAFNYKVTTDYGAALRQHCPAGIDCYFDNVGGEITDAVFPRLNLRARVAICGQISQYNAEKPEPGPRTLWHLIVKRASVEGFLVHDFSVQFPEARERLAGWLRSGRLKYRERITDGIENSPRAFMEMLQGANTGKQLVKLS